MRPIVYEYHAQVVDDAITGARMIDNLNESGGEDLRMQQQEDGRYLVSWKTAREDDDNQIHR